MDAQGWPVPLGHGPVREAVVHDAPAQPLVERYCWAAVVDDVEHELQPLVQRAAVHGPQQRRSQLVASCHGRDEQARHRREPRVSCGQWMAVGRVLLVPASLDMVAGVVAAKLKVPPARNWRLMV